MSNTGPVKTRLFWTWDHSTEWLLNKPGMQNMGASNYYSRTPEAFLEDYSRLLVWCGKHHFDGVVVWGLLRDCHGGVEAAKKLCDVANEAGVRLLCGVGLNAYGGVYYEGDSPYSLEQHLLKQPELYAKFEDGRTMVFDFGIAGRRLSHHACPSRKENQEFAVESLQWLFKTLPGLGGVQMETGDTGFCRCELCQARREHPEPGAPQSWDDMALMYPMATAAIKSVSPEAYLLLETYTHPMRAFGEEVPEWIGDTVRGFPAGTVVQWVSDGYVEPKAHNPWTDAGMVSNERYGNVIRSHMATTWMYQRREVAVDWLADMVSRSMAHGFDGVSMFGEDSPFHAGAELNYLALEHYGSPANPTADLDLFLDEVAAPLLGGEELARRYLAIARLQTQPELIAEALVEVGQIAGKLAPDQARRWLWLGNFLASYEWEGT